MADKYDEMDFNLSWIYYLFSDYNFESINQIEKLKIKKKIKKAHFKEDIVIFDKK